VSYMSGAGSYSVSTSDVLVVLDTFATASGTVIPFTLPIITNVPDGKVFVFMNLSASGVNPFNDAMQIQVNEDSPPMIDTTTYTPASPYLITTYGETVKVVNINAFGTPAWYIFPGMI